MNAPSERLDNKMLLAVIGRRIPAIFDVIPRHDLVKGESRPIPWVAVGAELGRLALQSAHAAKRAGGNPAIAKDYLDEWSDHLGEPVKLPPGVLGGYGGDRPPRPEEISKEALHLGIAIGLATGAAGLQDKDILDVVDQGIARSLNAMVAQDHMRLRTQ